MRVKDLQKELATMASDGHVWGDLGQRGNPPVFRRLDYLTGEAFTERHHKLMTVVLPAWRRAFEAGGFHLEQSGRDAVFAGRYVAGGYRVDVGATVAAQECEARWCVKLSYPLGGRYATGNHTVGRHSDGPIEAMDAAVRDALDSVGATYAEMVRQLGMSGRGKLTLTANERAALKAGVWGARWNWEQARRCQHMASAVLIPVCSAVFEEVGHG